MSFLPEMIVTACVSWEIFARNTSTPVKQGDPVVEPMSDEVEIVLELLKTKDDWNYGSRDPENILNSMNSSIAHPSGVRLDFFKDYEFEMIKHRMVDGYTNHVRLYLLDGDAKKYCSVKLSKREKDGILAAFKAHVARVTSAKRDELKRALAQRVLSGAVSPILGERGTAKLPPADEDDDSAWKLNTETTGLLYYDAARNRLVKTMPGNSRLEIDSSFSDRYQLLRPQRPTR